MITAKKIIPLLLLSSLAACATVDPAHLSKEQEKLTIEAARTKALPVLASEEERKIIKENNPKWGYYILSGSQAQYWFLWDVSDEVVVEVSGTGDIRTLEGGKVIKRRK